ncbi:MAG: D-alanyl-D-alanine carboxypeptidase family protein [Alkalibacterium sp.]|nr:D-alanyl-D-alanine carboxypeptidase family protein [Alkalibacterium sp.]
MRFNKWLLTTGLITGMLMLNGCDQSSDDSADEPDQEEIGENTETQPNEEGNDEEDTQPEENVEDTDDQTQEEESSDEGNEETAESDSDSSDESDNEDSDQSDTAENEAPELDLEEDILNPASISVLVNKEYSLPEDYVPANLVTVDVPTVLPNPEIKQMREVAADALKEMFDAAETSGIVLHARSGYRSYQTQVQLFRNYASTHGEEAANKYSARAGESEHQTGLVMDVTSDSVNNQITSEFGETEEGQWVSENAHEYGFIIRYPEGKSDITGYIYEPWHLRYLGEELATDVYESGLTYEEYLIERGLDIEIE